VVQGEVRIGKELSNFQNLLKDWFYTCAVVGVAFLFSLQVAMWTVAHVWVDRRRQLSLVEDDNPHDAFDTVNGGYTEIFHDDDDDNNNNDDDEWDDLLAPEEANDEANRTPNLANEHNSENETAPMTTTMDDDDPAQCNSDESKEEEEEPRPDTRIQGEDELLDMFTDHDPLDFQSVQ